MAVFDTPQEAFGVLRPVCVQLTKAQTVENVEHLQSQLQVVSDSALQELQEYVLFPLRFALKTPRPKRERVVQSVVQCLTFVLSTTCVKKPDLLLELFSELCVSLASPSALSQLAPCSEEVKQAVVQALLVLLHSAHGDIILSLYQPSNLPQLGFAVSLLLSMVEQEKAKQLKLSALKCLQALFLECDCPKSHRPLEEGERRQCGDLLASFLPGLSITLSQVIMADVKQGHALVVSALRLFSRAISLVMADEQLTQVTPEREKPALEPQSKIAELMVHRGPGWAQSTAAKLSVLVRKVVAFVSVHPHWKARQALVETACLLMSKCSRSLAESAGQLLKALVSLVNDERPDLQRQSKEALKSIAAQGKVAENRLLADVFSEDLHSLATALPRLLNSQDDQGKASTLNLLLGYVKLLGPSVNRVLTSASHLQRLSRALVQVLELEVNDVKVVEERRWGSEALREPDGPPLEHSWGSSWQGKHFRFFTEERIFLLLQQICRALGYYGNIYLLVDHFMELYRESASYRKQAAMVVNELIAGAAGLDVDILHERETDLSTENLREVVASVVDEYVDQANWHLVTTSMETQEAVGEPFGKPCGLLAVSPGASGQPFLSSETRPTVHSMNSNIWQICIQLEGIGLFGQALQEDFRLLLISVLYPVLEKAGGETLLISQAARRAMVEISRACGYTSLPELINQNADYLVDGISLHLRHQAHEAQAMRVLEAMLRHSDAKVLPLVGDVVQDTLARLDQCHHERVSSFLCAMQTLMTVIASWSGVGPPAKKDLEPEGGFSLRSALGPPRLTPEAMEEFFQAYVRQKRVAEGDLLEEDDDEDGGKEEPLPAPEPEAGDLADTGEIRLPFHTQTAKAVMERCIHLLSAESLRVRLQVLDTLEVCVMVLSPHEDLLLPLAHQAWPPLACRLTNDDPLAVLRAFRVLCTLGAHSGDFLRRRFSTDVLPKLVGSLVSQAPVSARAGPIYSHTLAFKLQLAVLQGLGSLCRTLDLGETDLDKVMEASLPYLSAKQPGRLQEAACSVFLHLMQMDPDALWFFLGSLWCPHAYEPPHHSLAPVKLGGMEKKRNEFSDNVQRLLDTLQKREAGSP